MRDGSRQRPGATLVVRAEELEERTLGGVRVRRQEERAVAQANHRHAGVRIQQGARRLGLPRLAAVLGQAPRDPVAAGSAEAQCRRGSMVVDRGDGRLKRRHGLRHLSAGQDRAVSRQSHPESPLVDELVVRGKPDGAVRQGDDRGSDQRAQVEERGEHQPPDRVPGTAFVGRLQVVDGAARPAPVAHADDEEMKDTMGIDPDHGIAQLPHNAFQGVLELLSGQCGPRVEDVAVAYARELDGHIAGALAGSREPGDEEIAAGKRRDRRRVGRRARGRKEDRPHPRRFVGGVLRRVDHEPRRCRRRNAPRRDHDPHDEKDLAPGDA